MSIIPLRFERERKGVLGNPYYQVRYGQQWYISNDGRFIIFMDKSGWRIQGWRPTIDAEPNLPEAFEESQLWQVRFVRRKDAVGALEQFMEEFR